MNDALRMMGTLSGSYLRRRCTRGVLARQSPRRHGRWRMRASAHMLSSRDALHHCRGGREAGGSEREEPTLTRDRHVEARARTISSEEERSVSTRAVSHRNHSPACAFCTDGMPTRPRSAGWFWRRRLQDPPDSASGWGHFAWPRRGTESGRCRARPWACREGALWSVARKAVRTGLMTIA